VTTVGPGEEPPVGLRERKKARTRSAIQYEALRLFREQGYDETTVEQIAEAAEISESTFYRYFPTKEDVVLWDALDPVMIEAFRRQPPELTPIRAMRGAFRAVFEASPPERWDEQRERLELIQAVPELRAAIADQIVGTVDGAAAMIAERVGRPAEDPAVRALAGAVIGVLLPLLPSLAHEPGAGWLALIDDALARLEAGLPLD
jgi:AcrR family transcriptional regulator